MTADQRGVVLGSILAIGLSVAVGAPAYYWLPRAWFGVAAMAGVGERIAFAIKWDILVLIWLAVCVRLVSRVRFASPADIAGSAFSPPSPAIVVPSAILQNSLEQSLLAIGAHLALAVTLRGRELALIPILVGLYVAGRLWFALGYRGGARGRAGGMVMTMAPTLFGLLLAGGLALAGR